MANADAQKAIEGLNGRDYNGRALRIDEARPLVRRLWLSGYREPALAQSLALAHIAFPPNPAFEQRLQDVLDQRALALAR